MRERINSLIDVKTFITFAITLVFCILALRGSIPIDKVTDIVMLVIVFYFGNQSGRKEAERRKETPIIH